MYSIAMKRTVVNGNEEKKYIYNGKEYSSLSERLKNEFGNHGEFYSAVFGVSKDDAYKAGWHPNDVEFATCCEGWAKFIKDKGIIKKTEEITTIDTDDLLFNSTLEKGA